MIKKLKPIEYQDHLCNEIALVLLRLKESYGLHVVEVYLDIKAGRSGLMLLNICGHQVGLESEVGTHLAH